MGERGVEAAGRPASRLGVAVAMTGVGPVQVSLLHSVEPEVYLPQTVSAAFALGKSAEAEYTMETICK